MNNQEARTILVAELARYCSYTYGDLQQLLGAPDTYDVTGPSGAKYQIEVVALDHRDGGLTVMASIDDGGWRALSPLTEGFAISPDGSATAGGDLGELLSLRQAIARTFYMPGLILKVNNGHSLTVMLSTSPDGALPDSEEGSLARQVAQYVRDHYTGYERLESVTIGFAKVVGEGPMKFTTSRVPYSFTRRELGPPTNTSKEPPD